MKPKEKTQNNAQKNAQTQAMQDDATELISKTKLKAAADAQQAIGKKLVDLSKEKLLKLNLPETLFEAIQEAKRLTANGAIRRQLQYIGRLMREVDTAPIEDQLHRWEGKHTEENAYFHQLENWRTRMLQNPQAVADFIAAYPATDSQQLRTLIRNAQKEAAANKPPKSSRELFKLLREITSGESSASEEPEQPI